MDVQEVSRDHVSANGGGYARSSDVLAAVAKIEAANAALEVGSERCGAAQQALTAAREDQWKLEAASNDAYAEFNALVKRADPSFWALAPKPPAPAARSTASLTEHEQQVWITAYNGALGPNGVNLSAVTRVGAPTRSQHAAQAAREAVEAYRSLANGQPPASSDASTNG